MMKAILFMSSDFLNPIGNSNGSFENGLGILVWHLRTGFKMASTIGIKNRIAAIVNSCLYKMKIMKGTVMLIFCTRLIIVHCRLEKYDFRNLVFK